VKKPTNALIQACLDELCDGGIENAGGHDQQIAAPNIAYSKAVADCVKQAFKDPAAWRALRREIEKSDVVPLLAQRDNAVLHFDPNEGDEEPTDDELDGMRRDT
jgi:hypothetical protein